MKPNEFVVENYLDVLRFLKSRFPMYHLSNFFFRDVQYGIMTMLNERGVHVTYPEAEQCARELTGRLEREKIFIPVDRQTWVVNFPEFRTEPVRNAAPAKPAPGQKTNPPGTGAGSANR